MEINKTMVLITIISLLACCIMMYPPFLNDNRQRQSTEPSTDNKTGVDRKIRPSVFDRANNPFDIITMGSQRIAAGMFSIVPEMEGIYIRDGTDTGRMAYYILLNRYAAAQIPVRYYNGAGYG